MPPALLALSPGTLRAGEFRRFIGALAAAQGAGLSGLLLREPGLSDREYLQLGCLIGELETEFWLGVHDRVHLAVELGAKGVHLGFRSLPAAAVQERFGAKLSVGLSTHAGDESKAWESADYLFHGPVFNTPSKPAGSPGQRPAIGIQGLERALDATSKPIWALGGLSPEHVQSCLQAGAQGVAVLSGILGSADPARATTLYLNAF